MFSFAQQIEFKNDLVDTITIKSNRSAYQFDGIGATKGVTETYIIVYNPSTKTYKSHKYFRNEYLMCADTNDDVIKTSNLARKFRNDITNEKIKMLLTAFNENVPPENLLEQIDTAFFRNYISKRQIRMLAKANKINWQFKPRYSSKEKNKLFYKSCQSIDTLKIYLNESYKSESFTIVTDYSNEIFVLVSTANSNYSFNGTYPNPVKQPWYNYSDSVNMFPSEILNFKINQSLIKLLPSDFLLLETISTSKLFDDYINWYFKRTRMKY